MRATARIGAAAPLLLWPALLNGYPLVFSDTGTYLSQVAHHHLGWDRPPFYSAFLLALSWQRTTWTVIAAQALIAAWVLDAARRTLLTRAPGWLTPALAAVLALASAMPWTVSELMPDVLTGLLVLTLAVLALAPNTSLGAGERAGLAAFATFAIAAHLSHVPLSLGLLPLLLLGRRFVVPCRPRLFPHLSPALSAPRPGEGASPAVRFPAFWLLAPIPLALAALVCVNLAGRGAVAIAPYGSVFLLARVLYDGPGRDTMASDCPGSGWKLCRWRADLPGTADEFLWRADSPLYRVGGPRAVSAEAGAIIRAAWRAEPGETAAAMLRNTGAQLVLAGTGDGLQPWPDTVSPWITGDFPEFEREAYGRARQTLGQALVVPWLAILHVAAGLLGCAVSLFMLPGLLRRRTPLGAGIVAVFAALILNAFVTGALSGPHARYQSRVMWLPVLTGCLALAEKQRAWR